MSSTHANLPLLGRLQRGEGMLHSLQAMGQAQLIFLPHTEMMSHMSLLLCKCFWLSARGRTLPVHTWFPWAPIPVIMYIISVQ